MNLSLTKELWPVIYELICWKKVVEVEFQSCNIEMNLAAINDVKNKLIPENLLIKNCRYNINSAKLIIKTFSSSLKTFKVENNAILEGDIYDAFWANLSHYFEKNKK